jgi:hypothetical protein
MKSITLPLLIAITILVSCSSSKESHSENKLEQDCRPMIEDFFKQLKERDTLALKKFLSSNEFLDITDSASQDLFSKFLLLGKTSGSLLSYSPLHKKVINNDIAAFSYLAKYEKRFYRYTFLFYNNSRDTRIFKFSIDEQAGFELEESLKIYLH